MPLTVSISDRDHIQGSVNASITLLKYGDYQCPRCQQAHQGIKALQTRSRVNQIDCSLAGGLPPRKLSKALRYIHQHLAEEVSLGAIATHLNMSQFYFCRLFKQSMGVTPYQYLLQQRIERAKQLLLQDELSIAEVALEVGFANQSHFCVRFKRWVGMSPKQFARRS
jgi:AraC family transcriptional regulator